MFRFIVAFVVLCLGSLHSTPPVWAGMVPFFTQYAQGWAHDPVILAAIRARGGLYDGFSAQQIAALDQSWQQQVESGSGQLLDAVTIGPAADFLRHQIIFSGGEITEIFVMDARGFTVAAAHPPSDFWQGDEAKFLESFGRGPGAVHVSEIDFDASTQTYQAQISLALSDPETGQVIGALTLGVQAVSIL